MKLLAALFVLAMAGTTPGRTQPPAPPPQASLLADQIELPRLVDLCAHRLRLTLEYDAAVIKGTVTLRQGEPITDDDLWLLTNRLLASRGFTTVRPPGDARTFSVVRMADAAAAAQVISVETFNATTGPQAGFVSVMTRTVHRPAKDLTEALRAILGKGAGSVVEVSGNAAAAVPAGPEASDRAGPIDGTDATRPGAAGVGVGTLLIISDLAPRVRQALTLLGTLDSPVDRIVVVDVPAKHLAATQLASLAGQVSLKQGTQSGRKSAGEVLAAPSGESVLVVAPESQVPAWRALLEQLDQREALQIVQYSARYFGVKDVGTLVEQAMKDGTGPGSDDRARVVIDNLTGTLIVTATPGQHERVRQVIDRLDSVSPAARRPIRTFVVRNRPVREMVDVVTKLLSAGVLGGSEGTEGAAGRAASPGPDGSGLASSDGSTPPHLRGPTGTSPPTTPAAAAPLRPRPPVEGRSAGRGANEAERQNELSLTTDEATNTLIAVGEPAVLGRLETLLQTLDVRQPQVMLEVLLVTLTDSQTLALGVELERLTRSGDAQVRLSSLFGLSTTNTGSTTPGVGGSGGTVTVLSPGDFSVVLRALETLNEGRSLSLPRLLVGNNQRGEFNAVTQQPIATTVTPSSQVTTTSFGGYEPAGTTVSVQPQITEADHLTLSYSVVLSSFTGAATGGLPPPRQENRLQSQVSIPDAYTVAVGGVEVTSDAEGTTQVPLLGSIPLVGELFKNRSNGRSRSRFFVFIRAEVMRSTNFEDLKYASDRTVQEAGVPDGLPPSVEPVLMR